MRIVKKAEFLGMPAGTVFALYKPCVVSEFEVKGESLGSSGYYYQGFDWIAADNDGEAIDRLQEMANDSSVSYPIEDSWSRNGSGCEGGEQLYLIYELEDIRHIIRQLENSVDVITSGKASEHD